MSVTIDSTEPGGTGHGSVNPTSPLTWSFTNTAGNFLIVGVALGAASGTATQNTQVNSVTYNGISMTEVASIKFDSDGTFTHDEVSLWSLVTPATGAKTVSIAYQFALSSTLNSIEAGAISFSGVNTSTALGSPSTAKFDTGAGTTSLSASIGSSTSGNIVVDCLGTGSGSAASSSGTIRWNLELDTGANAAIEGVSSTKASPGGSTSMGYTFAQDYAGLVVVEILAAGGAVAAVLEPQRTMRGAGV